MDGRAVTIAFPVELMAGALDVKSRLSGRWFILGSSTEFLILGQSETRLLAEICPFPPLARVPAMVCGTSAGTAPLFGIE
jgi:hypothetical protein